MFDDLQSTSTAIAHIEKEGMIYTLMERREMGSGSYVWKVLSDGVGTFFGVASILFKYRFIAAAAIVYIVVHRRQLL